MKIYLTAFGGKLTSLPMDWPESTPPDIKLALDMDNKAFSGYSGEEIIPNIPHQKLGYFSWNGKYAMYAGEESAKVYVLHDIS